MLFLHCNMSSFELLDFIDFLLISFDEMRSQELELQHNALFFFSINIEMYGNTLGCRCERL